MKKTNSLKRITNLIAVIVILLGVIPFAAAANITAVYADGEETTEPAAAAEETSVEEVSPAPEAEETAPEEAVVEEAVVEEAVVEEAVVEEAVVEEAVVEEAVVDLTEVVEAISENDIQIVGADGEALSMASLEAEDVLLSTDPFFWDSTLPTPGWVGYTVSGSGCPANVTCYPSPKPFKAAVAAAPPNSTIYVASGEYHEEVVVNTVGLSFTAFQTITVPTTNTLSVYTPGNAVVDKITLNADFVKTLGVYADLVVVNDSTHTDGRLDDAMALSNDGGRIEADVILYTDSGQYRIKDANHPGINYEWECGEPNTLIYNTKYRMTLMNPLDQTILDFYKTHGDERSTLDPSSLYYYNRTALERMNDLLIGVNVNEDTLGAFSWGEEDEKQIYWNLVGNIGKDNNGANLDVVTNDRYLEIDKIIDGTYNDVSRYWGIWFLWPGLANGIQDPNVRPGDGSYNGVSGTNNELTQLTFFVYDPRPVFGCMDPNALNYNPEATKANADCEYPKEQTPVDPGTPTVVLAPPPVDVLTIPVTGGENFLIPVTGADLSLQVLVPFGGTLLLGISFLVKGIYGKIKK